MAQIRRRYVCARIPRADGHGLRASRGDPEVGRTAVITNLVGLALAVAIVVFLFAALLFPERL
ncbi:hypothetical protein AU194_24480 [Mycobacterium sp. GA-2829]|nr:hypothetical protein AU194_24480 [Mycobacterium sp. GA-2829]